MSKTLFEEAVADAKRLREVAEKNAKNAVIEAVTPKIRSFIEEQLLGDNDTDENDNTNILSETAENIMADYNSDEEVTLDESALSALLELMGGEDMSNSLSDNSSRHQIFESIRGTLEKMSDKERNSLLNAADKINKNVESLESYEINNHRRLEENTMAMSDDIFYEVDLAALKEAAEKPADPLEELDIIIRGLPDPEDEEEEFDFSALSIEPWEEELEGDEELEVGEEEEVEVGADEEVEGEEDVDVDVDIEIPDLGALEEVYDIDPSMLRNELRKIRKLAEGDAKSMASSFGGGKAGKDVFEHPPNLNVLSEMKKVLRSQRRNNRALNEKLYKYRGAVQTLREQLEDLNLFNAKLLYVNKLLQDKNVTATQRRTSIQALDEARSLREVKLVYKSLTESFKGRGGKSINESKARRPIGSSRTTRSSGVSNSSSEVDRWAKLAGLK